MRCNGQIKLRWKSITCTVGSLLVPRAWKHSRLIRAILLILGLLYRFPIGAPLYVWQFIFGFSIHVWGNPLPYSLTIIFWLVALASFLRSIH